MHTTDHTAKQATADGSLGQTLLRFGVQDVIRVIDRTATGFLGQLLPHRRNRFLSADTQTADKRATGTVRHDALGDTANDTALDTQQVECVARRAKADS